MASARARVRVTRADRRVFCFDLPSRDPTWHGRPAHVGGDSFQNKWPWFRPAFNPFSACENPAQVLHAWVAMRNPNHTPARSPAEPGRRNRPAMDRFIVSPAVEDSAPRSGERQQADSASTAEFKFVRPPQNSWPSPYAYDARRQHTRTTPTNADTDTGRTHVYDTSHPFSGCSPARSYTYGPCCECFAMPSTFSEVNRRRSAPKAPNIVTGNNP
jgi:hypothetical protein